MVFAVIAPALAGKLPAFRDEVQDAEIKPGQHGLTSKNQKQSRHNGELHVGEIAERKLDHISGTQSQGNGCDEAEDRENQPRDQKAFQRSPVPQHPEFGCRRVQTDLDRNEFGEDGKERALIAEDQTNHGSNKAEGGPSTGRQPQAKRKKCQNPNKHHHQTRDAKCPARTHQQIQAQTAPAVTVGFQMGLPVTPIRTEGRRNLGDFELIQFRFDEHLQREFHARALDAQAFYGLLSKAPKTAIKVAAHFVTVNPAPQGAQHGIPNETVHEGHGPLGYPSGKTVAHHKIIPFAQFVHKWLQTQKIVAGVAVAHDHIPPMGLVNPRRQCRSVALPGHMHDPCPRLFCNFHRAIGAPVVSHNHFTIHSAHPQIFKGLPQTDRQSLGLVEAGHDNAQFHHKLFFGNGDWVFMARTTVRSIAPRDHLRGR
jgi:hypothetical protein